MVVVVSNVDGHGDVFLQDGAVEVLVALPPYLVNFVSGDGLP